MGTILSSRVQQDGSIVYEVSIDKEEALQLKGHMDGIHLISEKAADTKSRISFRGTQEATKYFLIPKSLRENIKKKKEVNCQRLETSTKHVYVYYVDKIDL